MYQNKKRIKQDIRKEKTRILKNPMKCCGQVWKTFKTAEIHCKDEVHCILVKNFKDIQYPIKPEADRLLKLADKKFSNDQNKSKNAKKRYLEEIFRIQQEKDEDQKEKNGLKNLKSITKSNFLMAFLTISQSYYNFWYILPF